MREKIVDPRIQYINDLFAEEDETLKDVYLAAQEINKEGIQVSPYEGKILQFLIQLSKAKKVVEIGTLVGYSAIWMARALPKDGKLYCLEKDDKNAEIARGFFEKVGLSHKIELKVGDALTSIEEIQTDGPFDMVFIDANKAAYEEYLDWAFENIASEGVIVGDNTFLFGNVLRDEPEKGISKNQFSAMKAFNQKLADHPNFTSVMLPTAEGMTVGVRG